jgi:DNA polymerase phi
MDSAGIKSYVISLLEQVNSPKDAEEYSILFLVRIQAAKMQSDREPSAIDSRRIWIADQFAALVRNGSIPKNDEWMQIVLDFYVVNGLFVICKKSENNPIHSVCWTPYVR